MARPTKLQCIFDDSLEGAYNTPKYIRGNKFEATTIFHKFEIIDIPVTKEMQVEYLESALNDDGGWTSFVCGSTEQCRMFAYSLMKHYAEETKSLLWHRVNGSRYDVLLDERFRKPYHMIVVDSLLTHPKMHPNGSRAYDPARIGKIYDIVGEYRGESSLVILCPDLTPDEAHSICLIQPDLMWYLKPKVKDVEL